jgi:hypothetical protein
MTAYSTPRSLARGLVNTDYPEKWSVTFSGDGSLHSRKEGSR